MAVRTYILQAILVLTVVTQFSSCTVPPGTPTRVENATRSLRDIRKEILTHLRSEQFKNRLMRQLIWSPAPKEKDQSRVHQEVAKPQPLPSKPGGLYRTYKRSSMILSEPVDSETNNMMKFRLEEWLDVSRLARVYLSINLKPQNKKRGSRKSKNRDNKNSKSSDDQSSKSTQSNSQIQENSSEKKNSIVCKNSPNCSKNQSISGESNEGNDVSKKALKKRRQRKNRPTVRLVVFALGLAGKKKIKIGFKRSKVSKLMTERIEMPLNLIKAAAASDDRTLSLLLRCRKCRGQVRLGSVYIRRKSKRKGDNNSRPKVLNPNRPYLFLEYLPKSQHETDQSNVTR